MLKEASGDDMKKLIISLIFLLLIGIVYAIPGQEIFDNLTIHGDLTMNNSNIHLNQDYRLNLGPAAYLFNNLSTETTQLHVGPLGVLEFLSLESYFLNDIFFVSKERFPTVYPFKVNTVNNITTIGNILDVKGNISFSSFSDDGFNAYRNITRCGKNLILKSKNISGEIVWNCTRDNTGIHQVGGTFIMNFTVNRTSEGNNNWTLHFFQDAFNISVKNITQGFNLFRNGSNAEAIMQIPASVFNMSGGDVDIFGELSVYPEKDVDLKGLFVRDNRVSTLNNDVDRVRFWFNVNNTGNDLKSLDLDTKHRPSGTTGTGYGSTTAIENIILRAGIWNIEDHPVFHFGASSTTKLIDQSASFLFQSSPEGIGKNITNTIYGIDTSFSRPNQPNADVTLKNLFYFNFNTINDGSSNDKGFINDTFIGYYLTDISSDSWHRANREETGIIIDTLKGNRTTGIQINRLEGTQLKQGIVLGQDGEGGDILFGENQDFQLRTYNASSVISANKTFGIAMKGPSGVMLPHFLVQPGGGTQASYIMRSFMIVNEDADFFSNTQNRTDCGRYMDRINETLKIDCNTTTSGADLLVSDDMQVVDEVWVTNSDGDWRFLTRTLTVLDDLHKNILFNRVNATVEGTDLVINDTEKDTLVINIDGNETIQTENSDSITLNTGTTISPTFNYVSYQTAGNPSLVIAGSDPSAPHADVAKVYVGDTTDNIYLFDVHASSNDEFVDLVHDRFDDQGAIYVRGLAIFSSATEINITDGTVKIRIDEMTYLNNITNTEDFYFVNSTGEFTNFTDNTIFTTYGDGGAIGVNKFFNVIWGVVPIAQNTSRLVAVVQNEPSTEYLTLSAAKADGFDVMNFFPNNNNLKTAFVPVARTIIKKAPTSSNFQQLNGHFHFDIRGEVTASGGSSSAPPITNHDELDNLEWNVAGHTFNDADQVADFGSYNFTGTGVSHITQNWTHVNYPTACPANSAITELGDTVICTDYFFLKNDTDMQPSNILMTTNREIQFRSSGQKIYSSAASTLDIEAIVINFNAIVFSMISPSTIMAISMQTTGTNGLFGFYGDTGQDYFQFSDDILMNTGENIFVRDKKINMSSPSSGNLDIKALTEINIDVPTLNISNTLNVNGHVNALANITVENSIKFNSSDWTSAPQIQYNGTCINMIFGTGGNGGIHVCQN